jgi:hypothetical protein
MTKTTRKLVTLTAALSAGTVFQTGLVPNSCGQALFQIGLNTFDFCAVFNCEAGTFFDFCSPVAILVDCPNIVDTTDDGTTP